MFGISGLRRILVKDVMVGTAIGFAIFLPIQWFVVTPDLKRQRNTLDFGAENMKDLGDAIRG